MSFVAKGKKFTKSRQTPHTALQNLSSKTAHPLKLNDGKTEVMIARRINQSIEDDDFGNSVMDDTNLVPTISVLNSGVIFDES